MNTEGSSCWWRAYSQSCSEPTRKSYISSLFLSSTLSCPLPRLFSSPSTSSSLLFLFIFLSIPLSSFYQFIHLSIKFKQSMYRLKEVQNPNNSTKHTISLSLSHPRQLVSNIFPLRYCMHTYFSIIRPFFFSK